MNYNILISNYKRNHVLEYIKEQKRINSNFKVIDIGATADYTDWSYNIVDFVIDINEFPNKDIKTFKVNVNYETQWQEVFNYVEEHGKFDFCICSHTLEDLALPAVTLKNMPLIAKEGFIATPSKYREFSRVASQPWLGYIHHRWIFAFKKEVFLALPKLNFIEHTELRKIGDSSQTISDLSFFWKDTLEFEILNNDYMGPAVTDVLGYYNILLENNLTIVPQWTSSLNTLSLEQPLTSEHTLETSQSSSTTEIQVVGL
jgi:hypothetical protein